MANLAEGLQNPYPACISLIFGHGIQRKNNVKISLKKAKIAGFCGQNPPGDWFPGRTVLYHPAPTGLYFHRGPALPTPAM
jgi:hypothetical protein